MGLSKRFAVALFSFLVLLMVLSITNLFTSSSEPILLEPPEEKGKTGGTVTASSHIQNVNMVPTSSSFLCDVMINATRIHRGCVETCVEIIGDRLVKFHCTIRDKASKCLASRADIAFDHYGIVPYRRSDGRPYLTVFYSGESNQTFPNQGNDEYQRQFDIVASYEHFRQYYFTWAHEYQRQIMKIMNENIQNGRPKEDDTLSEWQTRTSAIAVFISHCVPRRDRFIRALSSVYPVHSYAKCGTTHEMPSDCTQGHRYEQKMCVLRKYKYALTMENSREKDYVTEKVYHGLVGGAIPLYWGAPNIAAFVPTDSIIDLESFFPYQIGTEIIMKSQTATHTAATVMGDYLRRLETDRSSAMRHLNWRRAQRAEEWGLEFWDNLHHTDPVCGLCAEALRRRGDV